MVEIECEGVELDEATRRTLWGPLRGLVRLVDPDGRARIEVAIVGDGRGWTVSVMARDAVRRTSAEVREPDPRSAIHRAIEAAHAGWSAALAPREGTAPREPVWRDAPSA